MNVDLTGKTALVTGSTQGIGLAIARGLASAGARVIVMAKAGITAVKAVAAIGNRSATVTRWRRRLWSSRFR